MDTIQWGIIGCGDVTEKKSGPAFNKVGHSKLVAVMRRDGEKAKDYATRHGVPKWYNDAQQLIDDKEVNAIYVATPPLFHEEFTIRSLKAGKPVYVEKPMAISSQAAQNMVLASQNTGVKMSIAHYRRQQPLFKKIKSLIDGNSIGDVRIINLRLLQSVNPALVARTVVNWRVDPVLSGGGFFHDLAPHQLDLMQYFFGETFYASGISLNQASLYQPEDLVTGFIQFQNGTVFNGSWSFAVSLHEECDNCEITGSEGSIRFSIFKGHDITLIENGKKQVISFEALEHVQQPMIEAVVKYFLGKGPNPCTAAEGFETMRLMEAFTENPNLKK